MNKTHKEYNLYYCPKCFGLCLRIYNITKQSTRYDIGDSDYGDSYEYGDACEMYDHWEETHCPVCDTNLTETVNVSIELAIVRDLRWDQTIISLDPDSDTFEWIKDSIDEEHYKKLCVQSYKENL